MTFGTRNDVQVGGGVGALLAAGARAASRSGAGGSYASSATHTGSHTAARVEPVRAPCGCCAECERVLAVDPGIDSQEPVAQCGGGAGQVSRRASDLRDVGRGTAGAGGL